MVVFLPMIFLCGDPHQALAFSCTMSATNIAFGSNNFNSGSDVSSSGTMTLTCNGAPKNKTIRMCVSIVGGSAHNSSTRLMNGPGTPQLSYQLYSDASHTTVWGSWPLALYGGGVTWDIFSTGPNVTATKTFYGLAQGNQTSIIPGAYNSTLNLFFTYDNTNTAACPTPGKGNSSATILASATATSNCTIAASNLVFNSYTGNQLDAASQISLTCTNTAAWNVGLNQGTYPGATVTARKMTASAGSSLSYSLYRDSARTLNWGNTVGTDTAAGTGTGSVQTLTVYGRVPASQTPTAGGYVDTITATLTF